MAKKKLAEVNKKAEKELEERFKVYLKKLQDLNESEGFQPIAIEKFDERRGLYPFLSFEQYVVPKKPVETESKTDGQGNTDSENTKAKRSQD